MSKTLGRYSLALGVIVLGLVVASPAFAVCGSARLINGFDIETPGVCTGTYSFNCNIANGGAPFYSSISNNFSGSFWALATGNPAVGPGDDNGGWPATEIGGSGYSSGWISPGFYYKAYMGFVPDLNGATSWAADSRINGCIDAAPEPCMAVLLEDEVGGVGYYAYLTDSADAGQNYDFGGPILLAPIPKPAILGSSRPTSNSLELNVQSPSLGPGLFIDPACGSQPVSYKLFAQQTGEEAPSNPSRDSSDTNVWTEVGSNAIGADTTVTVNCTGDADVYLMQTITFDSGYELKIGSEDSLRAECGPNLAEEIRPTPVRPKSGQTVRPGRGAGRGR